MRVGVGLRARAGELPHEHVLLSESVGCGVVVPRRACAREPVLGDPHAQRRPLHEVRVAVKGEGEG